MSNGHQILNQNELHYLTFQVVEWIDIFTRFEYKNIVTDSFSYCRKNKGLELFSYVIMSNHIHLIARAKESFRLSDIIRDFKKFTANQLIERVKEPQESRNGWMLKQFEFAAKRHQRNSELQIWTHENHPVELRSQHLIEQKMNYIHQNPVRAGIVESPEEYIFSSAKNYAGIPAVIEIDYI